MVRKQQRQEDNPLNKKTTHTFERNETWRKEKENEI